MQEFCCKLALGLSSTTITGINMYNFYFEEVAAYCKDKENSLYR